MYMDEMNPTNQPPRIPRVGLAMASLILGILAVCLSFLLVGLLLGMVGVLLGGIHLAGERHYRGMAVGGVALSVLGCLMGVGFGVLYTFLYHEMAPAFSMDFMEEGNLEVWEGVEAPDTTLVALDGQEYTLRELRGRRVIIDIWATWCPPCRDEIPHFVQLASEHPADELIIIGVSDEDPETLRPFMEEMGINYPIVSQSGLPSPYDDVVSIPTTFFIDRNGVIQKVLSGYHDYEALRAAALADDYEGTPLDAPPVPRDGLLDSPITLAPEERWKHALADASAITAGDWEGDGVDEILATNWGGSLTVRSSGNTRAAGCRRIWRMCTGATWTVMGTTSSPPA